MTTITHRVGNTRNLTPAEVDANFDRLNTDVEALQAAPPSGVTAYTGLSDAATAALPTLNAPLVSALALKATTASVALKADTATVTAALALKANTADMTTALALKVPTTRTVNGNALSSDVTLTKTSIGLANVDNTSDLAKPVSGAQATAIALRAPGGTLVDEATTALTLSSIHNGNLVRTSNGSAVSITIPTGLPAGFSCVLVQGGAGLVTAVAGSGVTLTANSALVTAGVESDLIITPAGVDSYVVHSPGEGATTLAELTDIVTFDLGVENYSVSVIKATAEAALAGGTVVALISGTRGTGNVLTATLANGWEGTYQWQSYHTGAWNNVGSGGTSATHTELIADADRDIRCVFTPTSYASNVLEPVDGGAAFFRWNTIGTASVTESGSGPYTYTLSGTSNTSLTGGTLKMPSGVECEIVFTKTALCSSQGDEYSTFIFSADNTTPDTGTPELLGIGGSGGFTYFWKDTTSNDHDAGGVSIAVGSKLRLRKDASHVLYVDTWPTGGSSWTERASLAGSAIDYFIQGGFGTAGTSGAAYEVTSQTGMVAV